MNYILALAVVMGLVYLAARWIDRRTPDQKEMDEWMRQLFDTRRQPHDQRGEWRRVEWCPEQKMWRGWHECDAGCTNSLS